LENETCGKTGEEIDKLHLTYSGFELEKQFECRYEKLRFEAGKQLVSGESALKFVRSRHSGEHGGDFARHQRQQALLIGIKNKFLSLGALKNISKFYDLLIASVTSDIDKNLALSLIDSLGNLEDYSLTQVYLNEENYLVSSKSTDGQFILIPKAGNGNWTAVQQYITAQTK
jgi:anionic cell wall polymer biosynthesis LytR-Cps2A-Psr (LCP) family protein